MKKFKIGQRAMALILAVMILLQPFYGIKAFAEEETPTLTPTPVPVIEAVNENTQPEVAPVEPTVTPGNSAEAGATDSTVIIDNNEAEVDNNIDSSSNTGGNLVIEPTPTLDPESVSQETPTPTPEPSVEELLMEVTPIPTEGLEMLEMEGLTSTISGEPTIPPIIDETLEELTVTPTGEPQNFSEASSSDSITVVNDNETEAVNFSDSSSDTGNNSSSEKDSEIVTGDAVAGADVVNFVNTNLVGSDFWQLVINMFASSDDDIDLTKIEGYQSFDPALLSVLAKNDNTGDGSVNIALANFLSSYSVYNTNNAQLTNNVNVNANTGDNNIEGKRSEIETGDASAETNVFNLVNTNLVGNSWFFSIINFFKSQNGDLILPYELQYLLGDEANNGGSVTALNQNTGDGSQNQATACAIDSTTINNNNQANIDNNINVSSNTGNNTIIGEDGSISTGNAQSLVDLMNVINTNIYGSRWLLLTVNNYGNWNGDILGWWGNKVTIGNSTYIWIKLPDGFEPANQSGVTAVNQNTGDDSVNQAVAVQATSLEVVNNNTASVTNNINVQANTGNNQIEGKDSEINTGNASAVANIANIVNTNIIGNNWYFGVINIFGDFFGDIIFPRPDLHVVNTINKQSAVPGEEIIYTLNYGDSGRLWAKNVVVSDNFPSGITYVSSSNNGIFENGRVVWKFDKINSGDSGSVTVIARINPDVSTGTNITNCGNIATGTDEPNKNNNNSCVDVLITGTSQPEPTPTQGGGGIGGPEGEGQQGQTAGTTSTNGQGGSSATISCTSPEAPKAPNLISAENISPSEVNLTWLKVDRATHYLVSYGNFPGHYIYGNPNVGNTDSYTVGSLNPGETYYFVVSAVIDGDCPVAGPYSNELSNKAFTAGVLGEATDFNIGAGLGKEGDFNGGISTDAGKVAGAETKNTCPYWWYVLAGQTVLMTGFYAFLLKRKQLPKGWWITAPGLVAVAYFMDRYAHTHWYSPSSLCNYELWLSSLIAAVETAGLKLLKKNG